MKRTRATINFQSSQRVLSHFHNGYHTPAGLRDYFHVLEFVRQPQWTHTAFEQWVARAYGKEARSFDIPLLFFDSAGEPVDYSYLFDADRVVHVWQGQELVFQGKAEAFEVWLAEKWG